MNRRAFSKTIGAGVLSAGASAIAASPLTQTAVPNAKSKQNSLRPLTTSGKGCVFGSWSGNEGFGSESLPMTAQILRSLSVVF